MGMVNNGGQLILRIRFDRVWLAVPNLLNVPCLLFASFGLTKVKCPIVSSTNMFKQLKTLNEFAYLIFQ